MIGQPQFHSRGSMPLVPLIPEDAGTVAHVWFKNGTLIDTRGNSWTQNGTVPQVPRAGRTPAGAGPFSDANYYSLGTGNDVLDFAGDFSAAFVLAPSSADLSGSFAIPFSNGLFTSAGYFWQWATGGVLYFSTNWAASSANAQTATTTVAGRFSVVCVGRTGTSIVAKLNLGALATTAGTTIAAGTGQVARMGRYDATGRAMTGTMYEAWFSTTTPSDALFTSIMERVKSRAGVTAW